MLSAYTLSIKNLSEEKACYQFNVMNKEIISQSLTEPLQVPPGLVKKYPLFIKARKENGVRDRKILVALRKCNDPKQRLEKTVYFLLPDQ